ncbi:MAG: tetratricopeptide repeat protein [Planctomycetota bacterium]|jgi:tetratricopeptide (TPR) repeat protein
MSFYDTASAGAGVGDHPTRPKSHRRIHNHIQIPHCGAGHASCILAGVAHAWGYTIGAVVAVAAGFGVWRLGVARTSMEPPMLAEYPGREPLAEDLIRQTVAEVQAAPRDARRWAKLGTVYHTNRLPAFAEPCLEQAVKLDPRVARSWYYLALSRATLGDVIAAVDALDRTISLEPSYTPAYYQRGFWLLDQGRMDEAEASFRQATQHDENNPAGWVGLARVLVQREAYEQAAPLLQWALDQHPDQNAEYIRGLLATAYQHLGQWEQADQLRPKTAHLRAKWEDPWYTEGHDQFCRLGDWVVGHADRLLERGEVAETINRLQRLRPSRPDDSTLLEKLGRAYFMTGQLAPAIQALESAVAANPDHFSSHLNLAFAYERRADLDKALRHARKAIELNPAEGRAHLQCARVLLGRRDTAAAAAALAEAARCDIQDPGAQIVLARSWGELSRWDEAAATLERLTADYPKYAPGFVWLASARIELGAPHQARMALQRAAQLNPRDPAVQQVAARLEQLETRQRPGARDR